MNLRDQLIHGTKEMDWLISQAQERYFAGVNNDFQEILTQMRDKNRENRELAKGLAE